MKNRINLIQELNKLNIEFETKGCDILIDKLELLNSENKYSLGFIDHNLKNKKELLSSAKVKNIICDFEFQVSLS